MLQAIPGYSPFGDDDPSAPVAPDPDAVPPPVQAPTSTPASPNTPLPVIPFPGADPAPAVTPVAPAVSASRRAGIAILLAGTGVTTGALMGGAWGAGSGLLAAGALMNAYRSRTLWASTVATDRAEAVKTTVMAVVCLGGAGYLGYRARKK